MNTLLAKYRKWAFEKRIFISFTIVAVIVYLSFTLFKNKLMTGVFLFKLLGFLVNISQTLSFLLAALIMLAASFLRIWAGSILTPKTMMRFKVQNDRLVTIGPYRLVRNPIYLSDLIAFGGFAIVLSPIGLLLPVLLWLHYEQIIRHEEKALLERHGQVFQNYVNQVSRLLPRSNTLMNFLESRKEFVLTRQGIVHNALYLLFVPGFCLSALTHQLWQAIMIGLQGVLIWTILHLRLGAEKNNSAGKTVLSQR